MLCDVLWSEPVSEEKEEEFKNFQNNEVRGCGYIYGKQAIASFLDKSGAIAVVRGSEPLPHGYDFRRFNRESGFPEIISLFSCGNHCSMYNNKGAVMYFNKGVFDIKQFS